MKRAVNPFSAATGWGVNSKAAAIAVKRARAKEKGRQAKRSAPRPAPRCVDDLPGLIPVEQTLGQVILPFPPVELSPNWRGHWSTHSSAAREYRRMCWALALEAKLRVPDYAGAGGVIFVRLDFFPPNRAKRDDDNVPASFKAGRDGVADALRCDDARFRTSSVMHEDPRSCVVFSLIRPEDSGAQVLA